MGVGGDGGIIKTGRAQTDYGFYFLGFEFELKGAGIEREEEDKQRGRLGMRGRQPGLAVRTFERLEFKEVHLLPQPNHQTHHLSSNFLSLPKCRSIFIFKDCTKSILLLHAMMRK